MRKLLLASLLLVGCQVPRDDAERLMRQEGITNFAFDGIALFGCAKSDDITLKFSGTKNGQRVSGVICASAGLGGKKYTIRYD